jgi:cell division septation protein DedD
MSPVVIDRQGLFRLVFIALFFVILAFTGGVYLGYQLAAEDPDTGSESMFPSLAEITADDVESEADVDVDVETNTDESGKSEADVGTKVAENTTETSDNGNSEVSANTTAKASVASTDKVDEKAASEKEDNTASKQSAAVDEQEAKFTIQAGTYNRLQNARQKIEQLQELNLDAYVTGYFDKKNRQRFNVRIGRFPDKKSANSALDNYKKNHKGDGYLVNFSSKNIINTDE